MNLLVAERITKGYTEKALFDNISFGISEGDKIGLIGVNGTGKTTLLRVIAGEEEEDSGAITRTSKLRIAYLPQLPEFDTELTLLQNVVKGKKAAEDYRNIEGEAAAMLTKLGIEDVNCSPSILSGGQRKRAALVRTLLTDSDLLILDEPTNHLDSEMTEWLEEVLKKYKGAFLMVTHDRYFLDEVTNKIFELDKGCLYSYTANYSRFVELKAEREEMEQATERKNKSLFRTELAWMLRGARARSTKQKAHIQRFEQLRDRKQPEGSEAVEINSAYSRLGKKTVELENVCKTYGSKKLIKDFSYILLQNERIGIIGPNGCGKSTLVKLLTGQLMPDSGNVSFGETVKFGLFNQENEEIDGGIMVIDYIRNTSDSITTKDGVLTASKMCERFLFDGNMQHTLVSKLSGGEKRRLYLLKVLMEAPNVLVLDEPTNDLDIQTLTILEDYLMFFEGIVVAVSHDRYFLDKVMKRLFIFEGNGVISQSEGNYTDYRERLQENVESQNLEDKQQKQNVGRLGQSIKQTASEEPGRQRQREQKLKFSYKEQKEFETIDEDIAMLEADIAALDEQISAASTEYGRLTELMQEKQETEDRLDEKMERWMYLNELAEKMKE